MLMHPWALDVLLMPKKAGGVEKDTVTCPSTIYVWKIDGPSKRKETCLAMFERVHVACALV